jgi:hypothetical protein
MWSRLICVAAISFGLVPQTEAGEQSGLVHRVLHRRSVLRREIHRIRRGDVGAEPRGHRG